MGSSERSVDPRSCFHCLFDFAGSSLPCCFCPFSSPRVRCNRSIGAHQSERAKTAEFCIGHAMRIIPLLEKCTTHCGLKKTNHLLSSFFVFLLTGAAHIDKDLSAIPHGCSRRKESNYTSIYFTRLAGSFNKKIVISHQSRVVANCCDTSSLVF